MRRTRRGRTPATLLNRFLHSRLCYAAAAPVSGGDGGSEDDPISHMEEREAIGNRAGGFDPLTASKLVDDVYLNERGNEASS